MNDDPNFGFGFGLPVTLPPDHHPKPGTPLPGFVVSPAVANRANPFGAVRFPGPSIR